MNPKQTINAAAAAGSRAQDAASSAAQGAAAAASDAAQQLKDTVREIFPSSKAKNEHHLCDGSTIIPLLTVPVIAVLISLAVVILSVLFIYRRKWMGRCKTLTACKKLSRSGTVLICGPLDAGKTVLFHILAEGKFQETEASKGENVDTFNIHPKLLTEWNKKSLSQLKFEFIDYTASAPENLKINQYIYRLHGIILLVDASSNDSIINATKLLYALLQKRELMNRKVPILVCCNKTDLSESLNMNSIRSKMLEELNRLREAEGSIRTAEQQVAGDAEPKVIEKSNERLTWENLGVSVSFGQISAKKSHVKDVLDFLGDIEKSA